MERDNEGLRGKEGEVGVGEGATDDKQLHSMSYFFHILVQKCLEGE